MKRLLVVIIILLNCVPLICSAQSGIVSTTYITEDSLGSILKFQKNWLYNEQDDPSFSKPDYNDSDWYLIKRSDLPRVGHKKYPGDNFNSLAWFRLHFRTDSSLNNTPIALSVRQPGASEIYLDGRLIKRYGKINGKESEYYNPDGLPLIINLVPGDHVLAVRYANYNATRNSKIFESYDAGFDISVYNANNIIYFYALELKSNTFSITSFLFFFFSFGILHFILFIYNRSDKSNLYFSLFCFSFGSFFLHAISGILSANPLFHISGPEVYLIGVCLLCFSLSGFVNTLFGNSKRRQRTIALLCIIPLLLRITSSEASLISIGLLILLTAVEAFILNIKAIYNKVNGAKIVGIGVLSFNLIIIGFVLYAFFISQTILLSDQSVTLVALMLILLSIPISMSIYLSRNFALLNKSLSTQLEQVQVLSEKTMEQELEKQHLLENQKENLEKEVALRTSELQAQKQKSDDLLLNILPEEVAEELKEKGTSAAKYFDHVSVLFTDFVDFTKAGERLTPQQLVDELHTCFKKFDEICVKYNIEKIKTIGDAYLAVSGLPMSDKEHAINITKAAVEIREFIAERKRTIPDTSFNIRIGIHSGSVVAGIVGVKKFAYDIWGDTVNTAARMEQSSESGKINVSQFTYELIKDQFECTYRGQITAKNKGEMNMYFVEGEL